jgi:hypothetical protein
MDYQKRLIYSVMLCAGVPSGAKIFAKATPVVLSGNP